MHEVVVQSYSKYIAITVNWRKPPQKLQYKFTRTTNVGMQAYLYNYIECMNVAYGSAGRVELDVGGAGLVLY